MPPVRRSPSTRVYGGFVNPSNVTYFLVGGPFHGEKVTLPHPVADYSPIEKGAEERYIQNVVNLFGRRMTVLVHTSQNGNEVQVNEALANVLLQHPNIYEVWQQSPYSFQPVMDDTRVEAPLAETPR
jgi:hypothetical protein